MASYHIVQHHKHQDTICNIIERLGRCRDSHHHRNRDKICIGLARAIYTRCKHGIFGREITKYTCIYTCINTVLANGHIRV